MFAISYGQSANYNYTISTEDPNTHYYHISLEINNIDQDTLTLKMPVWTPGYYLILDHAKNIKSFEANTTTQELSLFKTNKNTFKVITNGSKTVQITYDVYAFERSVAHPFLDDGRAFMCPTGLFLYPENKEQSVTLKVIPFKSWKSITTGLSKIKETENTYFAKDFDVLYDSPLLAGDVATSSFDLNGISYEMAMENPPYLDISEKSNYVKDLKKIIETGSGIIGDIPYTKYAFLFMGKGYGGLEHLNSMAVYNNTEKYTVGNNDGYINWLSFIAHEYFHLYNVKSIRPIELGPFDYDHEVHTPMLWFSEGGTVYYEYMILNKAGIINTQKTLDMISGTIKAFENIPGRQFESAADSSFDTWNSFFSNSNHTNNTTISYYNIGCALTMILDLEIRHASENKNSLDNVIRYLYNHYHKELNRGFTDDEFQLACEKFATSSLDNFFKLTTSTEKIDYQKYLDYAGILIDTTPQPISKCFTGIQTNGTTISFIEFGSPAERAGLSVKDEILEINGKPYSKDNSINTVEAALNPNETITIKIKRRTGEKTLKLTLGSKSYPSYKMTLDPNATKAQKKFRENWLRN